MARYQIRKDRNEVSIELTEVAGHERVLLDAFGECQQGRCSCPTDEYQKVASIGVHALEDQIAIRLKAKPSEDFDASEIAACLDHTVGGMDPATGDSSQPGTRRC
jgi:hypothetical protein